jgi:hypothetical protein
MSTTNEDILSWVRSFVWSGEYSAEEVSQLIEDQLGLEAEVDEVWLRNAIHSEAEAKQKAEATWPKVTDFDRLDRAFTILQSQGIIALHRAGFTQSDGLEEVYDVYLEAGGPKSDYAGHCFYTEQDQEAAFDGSGLFIGFGHLSGNDAKGVEVGQLLLDALRREAFDIEWDGTINSRLFVNGFRWQRRSPW